jgi:UDP-N-acetylmuramoyl-tripeptide--D-alanyl-D-alanine ligase
LELALLQPGIGIVTVVRDDHVSNYSSRDAIAAEIQAHRCPPRRGTAVLNADDERVIAMGANCAAKVISYGTTRRTARRRHRPAWPGRLQLTLVRGAERVRLATQLCGSH